MHSSYNSSPQWSVPPSVSALEIGDTTLTPLSALVPPHSRRAPPTSLITVTMYNKPGGGGIHGPNPWAQSSPSFAQAVVRVTRRSVSVYRASDRTFFQEYPWSSVADVRHHRPPPPPPSHYNEHYVPVTMEIALVLKAGGFVLFDVAVPHIAEDLLHSFAMMRNPSPISPYYYNNGTTGGSSPLRDGSSRDPSRMSQQGPGYYAGGSPIQRADVAAFSREQSSERAQSVLSRMSGGVHLTAQAAPIPLSEDAESLLRRLRSREESMRQDILHRPCSAATSRSHSTASTVYAAVAAASLSRQRDASPDVRSHSSSLLHGGLYNSTQQQQDARRREAASLRSSRPQPTTTQSPPPAAYRAPTPTTSTIPTSTTTVTSASRSEQQQSPLYPPTQRQSSSSAALPPRFPSSTAPYQSSQHRETHEESEPTSRSSLGAPTATLRTSVPAQPRPTTTTSSSLASMLDLSEDAAELRETLERQQRDADQGLEAQMQRLAAYNNNKPSNVPSSVNVVAKGPLTLPTTPTPFGGGGLESPPQSPDYRQNPNGATTTSVVTQPLSAPPPPPVVVAPRAVAVAAPPAVVTPPPAPQAVPPPQLPPPTPPAPTPTVAAPPAAVAVPPVVEENTTPGEGWITVMDPKGKPYYVHKATKKTTRKVHETREGGEQAAATPVPVAPVAPSVPAPTAKVPPPPPSVVAAPPAPVPPPPTKNIPPPPVAAPLPTPIAKAEPTPQPVAAPTPTAPQPTPTPAAVPPPPVAQPSTTTPTTSHHVEEPAAEALITDTDATKKENETRKAAAAAKAEQDKQGIKFGGMSLMDALMREKASAEAAAAAAKEEKKAVAPSNTNSDKKDEKTDTASPTPTTATPKESATAAVSGGGGGANAASKIFGSYKEFYNKEKGKYYYRHIVTNEATWTVPPEVVEAKAAMAAKEAQSIPTQHIPKPAAAPPTETKKETPTGAATPAPAAQQSQNRVKGDWKEATDPKSGRLYYIHMVTKQRTWKREETSFAEQQEY